MMIGNPGLLLFPVVKRCKSCWNLLLNQRFGASARVLRSSLNATQTAHVEYEDNTPEVKKYAYGKTGLEKRDKEAPGLFYLKTICLPEQLDKNLGRYLRRFPKKVVENDGRKLARHLKNRGRPTELTWKKYRESRRRNAIDRESQVDPDEILKWEEQRRKTAGSVLNESDEGSEDDDEEDNNDDDSVDDVDEQYECQEFKDEGDKENRHLNQENSTVDVEAEIDKTAAHNVKDAKKTNPTKKPKRSEFKVIRYDQRETTAYAASRIPASYGATLRVFHEISRREPDFRPETLLDFGSGTGTATWAAHAKWGDSIQEYQCIDISQDMNTLAEYLLRGGDGFKNPLHIPQVYFKRFLPVSNLITYNVVVASYALSEMPKVSLRQLAVRSLWGKTSDFLVIIEHGNSEGFEITLEARNLVLKEGGCESVEIGSSAGQDYQFMDPSAEEMDAGFVFSPCPHDIKCARSDAETRDHPCNFEQRVQLAFCQKDTSLKKMGYYTERFSYIVLRKGARAETDKPWPRVLQAVKLKRRHIICKLCCSTGELRKKTYTKKKDRDIYKCARHLTKWGDLLADPEDRQRPVKNLNISKKNN